MAVLTGSLAGAATAALVLDAPGEASLQHLPTPEVPAAGGLGRVVAAGVCGSDLSLFRGEVRLPEPAPFVLGHEMVVEVEDASPALLERWGARPGDVVLVEEFIPCGWCPRCRGGRYQRCPRTDFHERGAHRYGRTPLSVPPGLWGGFAERIYLDPDARLHPLPPGLQPERAVLATPLANGLHWITEVARLEPLDAVVVIGPGAHGLGCVTAARLGGAGKIIVVGTAADGSRLEVARALGADHTLTVEHGDVADEVWALTEGRGAEVVVEVAGAPTAMNLALRLAGDGGRVVCAGNGPPADQFPLDLIGRRELSVRGVRGHRGTDLARALELLADGRFDLGEAHTVGLGQAPRLLAALAGREVPDPAPHYVVAPGR